MIFPPPYARRFSVQDYYRMGEYGILKPDEQTELLEGQVMTLPHPSVRHANTTRRLLRLFAGPCKGRWLMDARNPVHLDEYSEPRPDFMLVRPLDGEYDQRLPAPQDVFLLVEVADNYIQYDREAKLPAYARAGIQEYWIVNLVEGMVKVYREPLPSGTYGSTAEKRDQDQIALAAFPDTTITVSELVKPGLTVG